MPTQEHQTRIRFGPFDLDLQTRELRKSGLPVKLQDQPGKLLVLLARRAGELVTRAEIEKALWREDEFVEFDHAVNTAVRKVREALGDELDNPRFIETLPRKGYRFIAAVEIAADKDSAAIRSSLPAAADRETPKPASQVENATTPAPPASAGGFRLSVPLARLLFLIVQIGYLAMYCTALYNAEGVEEVLRHVFEGRVAVFAPVVLVAAMCGIAVRLYLLAAVGLNHPAAGEKFRRLFPLLFVLDTLWAVSPLLIVYIIGYGLALGAIAPLAYLPFSQRTLMQTIYRSP